MTRGHNATIHSYLQSHTSSGAIATAVILAHNPFLKRRRLLVNEAYSTCGDANTEQPAATSPPPVHLFEHEPAFSFHNSDDNAEAPTITSTTSECCMVKLMKSWSILVPLTMH
jgi:hypothetical protein